MLGELFVVRLMTIFVAVVFMMGVFSLFQNKQVVAVWMFHTNGEVESSPGIGNDEAVIFTSEDGHIYAIDIDGTLKWKFEAGGILDRTAPVLDANGTIYVGSSNGFLFALRSDGSLVWKVDVGRPVQNVGLSENNLYVAAGDDLLAFDTSGKQHWIFTEPRAKVWSPCITKDGQIYIGSEDGTLYAVLPNGKEAWRFIGSEQYQIKSSPAISDAGNVYIGNEAGILYALDSNGHILWTFTAEKRRGAVSTGFESSPAIGKDGTIYVGSKNHFLYALTSDGKEKWKYKTGWEIESSPAIGSDDTIYVGSEDKKLHAVSPEGKRLWVLETDGQVDSSPTIAPAGVLYVGSQDGGLYAVKMGSRGLAGTSWPKFRQNVKNSGGFK